MTLWFPVVCLHAPLGCMFHTGWANTGSIPLDHMGLDTALHTVSTCCVLVLAGYWRNLCALSPYRVHSPAAPLAVHMPGMSSPLGAGTASAWNTLPLGIHSANFLTSLKS